MSRILIIDDDLEFLQTIKIILSDKGFKVETTFTQDYIYEHILAFDPDLILLDINLNGADGRNICMGLKNHFRTKSIPIILISADVKIKDDYPKYQAEDFIEKPFDYESLVYRLDNYFKKSSSEGKMTA